MSFITVIRHEIDRLQQLIATAASAEAQLNVLRGTLEMLQDIEDGKTAPSGSPPVPRFELPPPDIERKERIGAKVFNEAFSTIYTPESSLAAPGTAKDGLVEIDMPIHEPAIEQAVQPPELAAEPLEEPKTVVPGPVTDSEPIYTDAATLEALTPRQIAVFGAVWKLKSIGNPLTAKAVGKETGGSYAPNDVLNVLVAKHYVERVPKTFPTQFRPLAMGIPRVWEASSARQPTNGTNHGDAERGHLDSDPIAGRSALDKKRDLDELDPTGYLIGKGHVCRRITQDTYQLDGNTVPLKRILEEINIYRTRGHLKSLDIKRYL